VRRWYRVQVIGYVVMREHVHLLMSEPERSSLATALQVVKRHSSRRLRKPAIAACGKKAIMTLACSVRVSGREAALYAQ
jgi:REP element-mobilizing transposase RayT